MNDDPTNNRLQWALFFALLLVVVGLNLAWHATHPAPVITGHRTLLVAAHQLDELARDPVNHLRHLFTGQLSGRPYSLYNASAALTFFPMGGGTRSALLISTVYLLLLMAGVFGIVRRLQPGAGALAAVAAALCPAAMIWSRVFSAHIALMAMAAVGVYLLVRSEWFTRPLPALAFALLAGLSWRLAETVGDNLQLQLVLAGVALYVFLTAMIRPERGRLRPLVIAAIAAALFAVLIPEPILTNAMRYGRLEGLDSAETRYAAGNLRQNPSAWLAYPAILWDQHLGPVLAVAVTVAVAWTLRRPTKADGIGIAFFVVPLIVATLISKKRFNYVFALLPGAAVIIGLAVGRLRQIWLSYALAFALAVVALVGAVWQPFRAYNPNVRPTLVESTWYARYFQSAGEDQINPPRTPHSALSRIVADAQRLAARPDGLRLTLLGQTFTGSHITAARAMLRLDNADGRISVADPVAELTDFCTDAAQHLAAPSGCVEPDVIVFFPKDQRPLKEIAHDPQAWRLLLSPANECTRLATGDSITAPEFVDAWSACLTALPWEKYRARSFSDHAGFAQLNRGIVLDRPDRGVSIDLPPMAPAGHGIHGPLGPPPSPGTHPSGPPPHAD